MNSLINTQLTGLGHYHDIEQQTFKYSALIDAAGTNDFNTNPSEPVLDFDELLDRRNELADLLHMEIRHVLEIGETEDIVEADVDQAYAEAYLRANSGDEFDNIMEREFYDNSVNFGDFTVGDDSYDILHAPLSAQVYNSFEDQANSTGGGGGGPGDAHLVKKGWHLADPTFDSRDELEASSRVQIKQGTGNVRTTLIGQLLFGVYDSSHMTG